MNLGRSINLAMAYKGIKNQKALAVLTGITEASMSNMIANKGNPGIKTVERVAYELGYSMSEFIKLGEVK